MFITLEGPDGSGKTTQVPRLAEYLRSRGLQVLTTREPGGTPISDQVRQVIMSMKNQEMDPRTEILLFCAARAQLVNQLVRPALEQGMIVISDRYADSTLAYQGYGHGYDRDFLRQLLHFATGGLVPDLTCYIDLDAETGLLRRKKGGEWNRMDAYQLDFHRRVRQGYLEMARQEPQRWVVIDGSQPVADVQAALQQAVSERLKLISNP